LQVYRKLLKHEGKVNIKKKTSPPFNLNPSDIGLQTFDIRVYSFIKGNPLQLTTCALTMSGPDGGPSCNTGAIYGNALIGEDLSTCQKGGWDRNSP
jgi:hypothetical protein